MFRNKLDLIYYRSKMSTHYGHCYQLKEIWITVKLSILTIVDFIFKSIQSLILPHHLEPGYIKTFCKDNILLKYELQQKYKLIISTKVQK